MTGPLFAVAPPPFSMAPLAGVTDAAFRARLRRNGCRWLVTEMVSAAALARGNRRTRSYLLAPDRGADLAVQLFGARPEELAAAADLAQEAGFHHLDLNMGCPVKKVVRSGAGAALLCDLPLARRCLEALRRAVRGTLSVKLRSGWDRASINCLETGRMAADCGVDLVVLHPRTRSQGYTGTADWSLVAALASAVPVPVVGNGDVASGGEALERLRGSGCRGVMIGRAALSRPWIFREAEAAWGGRPTAPAPVPAEVGADLLQQMADLTADKGGRVALFEMRKFLAWAAKGMPGAAEFRRRVQGAADLTALERQVREFFCAGESPVGGSAE